METYADLVIINAHVHTVDRELPRAEAIAFKGDTILAVGSDDEISKYINKKHTKIIQAKGRLVIPGFNDAHAHFKAIDLEYIELRYISDPKIITQKVAERVKQVQPGELIYGGHWEHELFDNKQWPTKELLDSVAPDNPVVLSRTDGHASLVNSYVLKASGITRNTPDPFGGEIQRDPETGEATGILLESAEKMIVTGEMKRKRSEEEALKKEKEGWIAAFEWASSMGVTSIQLPGDEVVDVFQELKNEGKLTARIELSAMLTEDRSRLVELQELKEKYPASNDWIRFGYLKDFIDGTLGSATMMVFREFDDDPGNTGLPQMPYKTLERKVLLADSLGFQVGVHAIGPKANRWVLDAYENASNVNGKRDSRHRIEHAQILAEEDLGRFAELGVIASMQPTHCITDKRFCEKRIGTAHCKYAYAWRSLLNKGTRIAFGTDYSVEPLNPMEGLYAAVTRKDRKGEAGEGWFPEQKLSMAEAIELYTLGSAYAQFMEDRKGMIKPGYLGDVVMLNQNLFTIGKADIMKTLIDYTIIGGRIVYFRK